MKIPTPEEIGHARYQEIDGDLRRRYILSACVESARAMGEAIAKALREDATEEHTKDDGFVGDALLILLAEEIEESIGKKP